ncbi:MAG: hypothetical protein ACTSWI_00515, partial [Alphaproteobacteria bacterium]
MPTVSTAGGQEPTSKGAIVGAGMDNGAALFPRTGQAREIVNEPDRTAIRASDIDSDQSGGRRARPGT